MGKVIDLTGRVFGFLTAIEFDGFNSRKQATWSCRCVCGRTTLVQCKDLRSGHIVSCGCWRVKRLASHSKKHGETGSAITKEYRTWQALITRCTNSKVKCFPNYGGRGISVCERWRNDFAAFLADMGRAPTPAHSIDRIDNDGPYAPDNCRWATRIEQRANQRPIVRGVEDARRELAELGVATREAKA